MDWADYLWRLSLLVLLVYAAANLGARRGADQAIRAMRAERPTPPGEGNRT